MDVVKRDRLVRVDYETRGGTIKTVPSRRSTTAVIAGDYEMKVTDNFVFLTADATGDATVLLPSDPDHNPLCFRNDSAVRMKLVPMDGVPIEDEDSYVIEPCKTAFVLSDGLAFWVAIGRPRIVCASGEVHQA